MMKLFKDTAPPQKFTVDFKKSCVELVLESRKPTVQVAEELGINANTLHSWVRKAKGLNRKSILQNLKEKLADVTAKYDILKKTYDNMCIELQSYEESYLPKEELLKEERDLLKKAAIYFAKECKF